MIPRWRGSGSDTSPSSLPLRPLHRAGTPSARPQWVTVRWGWRCVCGGGGGGAVVGESGMRVPLITIAACLLRPLIAKHLDCTTRALAGESGGGGGRPVERKQRGRLPPVALVSVRVCVAVRHHPSDVRKAKAVHGAPGGLQCTFLEHADDDQELVEFGVFRAVGGHQLLPNRALPEEKRDYASAPRTYDARQMGRVCRRASESNGPCLPPSSASRIPPSEAVQRAPLLCHLPSFIG